MPGNAEGDAQQSEPQRGKALRHMAEWLDGKLLPRLGPPHLGPYDAESEDSMRAHDVCPLCAHPMGEHVIDRSHPNAVLICPVPPVPEVQSFEPLNEVGMPKGAPQAER